MPNIQKTIETITAVKDDPATPPAVVEWLTELLTLLYEPDPVDERIIKGSPIPTALGAQVDEYAYVREERLKLDRQSAEVKERESELYNCMLSTLAESTDTGASGNTHRVQLVEKEYATVKDWDTFLNHVKATGSFELMRRSLNEKAALETLEDNENVPGVEVSVVSRLSITKI